MRWDRTAQCRQRSVQMGSFLIQMILPCRHGVSPQLLALKLKRGRLTVTRRFKTQARAARVARDPLLKNSGPGASPPRALGATGEGCPGQARVNKIFRNMQAEKNKTHLRGLLLLAAQHVSVLTNALILTGILVFLCRSTHSSRKTLIQISVLMRQHASTAREGIRQHL